MVQNRVFLHHLHNRMYVWLYGCMAEKIYTFIIIFIDIFGFFQ